MIKTYIKTKNYDAIAYYEYGRIIIQKGSKISKCFSTNFAFSKKVKAIRDNNKLVDVNYITKENIEFSSPSTAAQFVVGYSVNGWKTWKISNKIYLETMRG